MQTRPRLKSHVSRALVDDDKLFIVDEGRHFLLEGRAAVSLALLLDGTHELEELFGEHGLPLDDVLRTIHGLDRIGQLADGPGIQDLQANAYWDGFGVEPGQANARLARSAVTLTVLGAGDADNKIRCALTASGLTVQEDAVSTNNGSGPVLDLVVCDDYLDPELERINREHLASGEPWLLARPRGMTIWLGPVFQPGATACWTCLARRLAGNRQAESYIAGKGDAATLRAATPASVQPSLQLAAGLLASEAEMILAGAEARVRDRLITIDLRTLESSSHSVVRLPQCPACGDPTIIGRGGPRVTLTPQRKRFTDDGGHRVQRPEETLARLSSQISPLTGAVSTVERQSRTDNGVAYSYSSGHNFALIQDNMHFLRRNMRGRSGGKGRTDQQARVGAVCEAIERYNGVWRGDEPRRRAAWSELADAEGGGAGISGTAVRAVHPEALLLFSDRQYAERDAWNAAQRSGYHVVPGRLPDELEIDWTPCWSLTHSQEVLVASAYCYFGHPDINASFYCAGDANGCAAGNTLEEAILQGLMELVERDCVALWWYNRVRRPAVDLDSFEEPYVEQVRRLYREQGRELWVLDITNDLAVPTFAAISRRVGGPTEDILLAFGAHVDPTMALLRSLTELNQFLPAVVGRNPDGSTSYWMDDRDAIEWWTTATLESDPYVVADASAPARERSDYATVVSDDISEDVRGVIDRLASVGLETIVLDQTRPDIDLAVAKVMVPGLRHFWRRLGPGRLYQTPVSLGWLERPLAEGELNPKSIFF